MVILAVVAEMPKASVLTTLAGWIMCGLGTASMGLFLLDRIQKLERKGKDDAGS